MLDKVAENIFIYNLNNKKLLREVIVKIGLERVDMQKEVTVEMLLDSGAIELVMSLEFVRKQRFKLKNKKSNICEKCRQNIQQEVTNKKYSRSKYLLPRTQEEDGDRCNQRTEVECNLGNTMACLPQL